MHGEFEPMKATLACQSLPQGEVRSLLTSHMPKLPKSVLELDEIFTELILIFKTKCSESFKVYLLRLTQPLVH